MNMSNIKNMNINIINQVPVQPGINNNYMMQGSLDNEEFINNFSKLNMRNESGYGVKSKKDMAYNYYFGQPGGDSGNMGINYDNPGMPTGIPNFPEDSNLEYDNPNFFNQMQMPNQSVQPNAYFDQRNIMGFNPNQQMNMNTPNKGKYYNEKNNFNKGQFNKGFGNKNFKNNGNGYNNRNKYSMGNNNDQSNIIFIKII
jgi:hypothetical protein